MSGEGRVKVARKWAFDHERPVDSVSLADVSGDTLICDLRNTVVLLDGDGREVWGQTMEYAPLTAKLTEAADAAFLLTVDGRLVRIDREGNIAWDCWVDRNPLALALKPRGQAAAVGSHKARFCVVSGVGKKLRLVHTPEPVTFMKFSSRTGGLFVASSFGWVGLYDKGYNPMGEYRLGMPISTMKVTDWGRKIFLPARDMGLQVIEVETSELVTYSLDFNVGSVAIDSKGERIVAAGLDGHAALLDSAGRTLWFTETKHSWIGAEMTRDGGSFLLLSDKGHVACYAVGAEAEKRKAEGGHFDFLEV